MGSSQLNMMDASNKQEYTSLLKKKNAFLRNVPKMFCGQPYEFLKLDLLQPLSHLFHLNVIIAMSCFATHMLYCTSSRASLNNMKSFFYLILHYAL